MPFDGKIRKSKTKQKINRLKKCGGSQQKNLLGDLDYNRGINVGHNMNNLR